MDRNRDNLITYEEFRYYVSYVLGDNSQLGVPSGFGELSEADVSRLENWRDHWQSAGGAEDSKINKEEAIAAMKEYAREPMSPGLVRALQNQMDINGDGQIDFYEFSRACEKVL